MGYPSFGSYDLPGRIQLMGDDIALRPRTADPAGRDGIISQGALLGAKRIPIRSRVVCTSFSAAETAWQAIKAGLAPRVRRALILPQATDRRYQAEVESLTRITDPALWTFDYEVGFLVPSGCSEAVTATSVTGLTSGANTISSPSGDEEALPTITLVVSVIGTITLAADLGGQSMVIAPTSTGTYLINSEAETITKAGVDASSIWSSGAFPTFVPGSANTLTITLAGGATLTSASLTYRARWR